MVTVQLAVWMAVCLGTGLTCALAACPMIGQLTRLNVQLAVQLVGLTCVHQLRALVRVHAHRTWPGFTAVVTARTQCTGTQICTHNWLPHPPHACSVGLSWPEVELRFKGVSVDANVNVDTRGAWDGGSGEAHRHMGARSCHHDEHPCWCCGKSHLTH